MVRKKSPVLSLRGAARRGDLVFPSSYQLRDCFVLRAKTAFQTYYECIKKLLTLPFSFITAFLSRIYAVVPFPGLAGC